MSLYVNDSLVAKIYSSPFFPLIVTSSSSFFPFLSSWWSLIKTPALIEFDKKKKKSEGQLAKPFVSLRGSLPTHRVIVPTFTGASLKDMVYFYFFRWRFGFPKERKLRWTQITEQLTVRLRLTSKEMEFTTRDMHRIRQLSDITHLGGLTTWKTKCQKNK